MLNRFSVKKDRSNWVGVWTKLPIDDNGERPNPVMITAFLGSEARKEAKRLCDLLNKACLDFYRGKEVKHAEKESNQ